MIQKPKAINEFIVHFPETHKTSIQVGGVEMDVNPFFEQPKWINRVGIVVSVPEIIDTKIKEGDEVLVVHTSLLHETYKKTGRKESFFCVDPEKNYFRFENNLIFMYRKNSTEKWKCNAENIFVRPIPEKVLTIAGLEIPPDALEESLAYKGNRKQMGELAYINNTLRESGLKEGDKVCFKFDREYEFELDGEILYHMENNDLLMAEKV